MMRKKIRFCDCCGDDAIASNTGAKLCMYIPTISASRHSRSLFTVFAAIKVVLMRQLLSRGDRRVLRPVDCCDTVVVFYCTMFAAGECTFCSLGHSSGRAKNSQIERTKSNTVIRRTMGPNDVPFGRVLRQLVMLPGKDTLAFIY